MNQQDIFNAMMSVGVAGFSWLLKTVWDAIGALKESLISLEREMHISYVSKADYRQDITEMKDMLKAIFEKLDKKADK
jgi:hypothetical protein